MATTQISNKDLDMFHEAVSTSFNSTLRFQHGAVLTVGGKIIAKGCNQARCHTRDGFVHNSCTCHAEITVIRQAFHQFDGKGKGKGNGNSKRGCKSRPSNVVLG